MLHRWRKNVLTAQEREEDARTIAIVKIGAVGLLGLLGLIALKRTPQRVEVTHVHTHVGLPGGGVSCT